MSEDDTVNICHAAAQEKNINVLKWLETHNFDPKNRVCTVTAGYNMWATLRWLQQQEYSLV